MHDLFYSVLEKNIIFAKRRMKKKNFSRGHTKSANEIDFFFKIIIENIVHKS
jgi:hypothetical protein